MAKRAGPPITWSGAKPIIDGVTPHANAILVEATRLRPFVGLISAAKTVHDHDAGEGGAFYSVLHQRHVELALEEEDIKALTEVLARIYAKRMQREGVGQGELLLPMDPGGEFDALRDYSPQQQAEADAG